MSQSWQAQKERAGKFWIVTLVWIALNVGRKPTLFILKPITFFYLFFAPDAVLASKNYLRRVLDHEPSRADIWKHFYYFAVVSIDRLYFLADKTNHLSVETYGAEVLQGYLERKEGCILLVSHLGSFDALRATALTHEGLPLKILMDHQHNPAIMKLIDQLNPELAKCIVDSNQPAPELALSLAEDLKQGKMIGIMADRQTKQEKSVTCTLLGEQARFPVSPWLLASVLKSPVFMCVGLYDGDARYKIHIELLEEKLDIKRKNRQILLSQHMQNYADKIECHLKNTPYNWFNFYDFWQIETDETSPNATFKN